MARREARQELSGVENCKRNFLNGGVFSAAVCRQRGQRGVGWCEDEDETGEEGALAQADCDMDMVTAGGRRGLQNEALAGERTSGRTLVWLL